MIGFRGASRYYSERYREGFALECAPVRRVREEMGLENLVLMIPSVLRSKKAVVLLELEKNGLVRGERGLAVYVMCEISSNVLLADEFSDHL